MSLEIEVITDEAVQNQINATAVFTEKAVDYIALMQKNGNELSEYSLEDALKLAQLNLEITKAGEELQNTSIQLIAENSYIEAVSK